MDKLTDAVTDKFRKAVYQRLSNTLDFGQGNIMPEVVLDVMGEELDKLRDDRVKVESVKTSEPPKVLRDVVGPSEDDNVDEDEDPWG